MTTNRPLSVTIIGWFLVVTAVSSLPSTLSPSRREAFEVVAARRSVPIALQQAMSVVGTVVNLVGGYFLLRGKNWARFLVLAWSVTQLGYSFLVSPVTVPLLFGMPMALLGAYFLLRRPAGDFFDSVGAGATICNELSWRRIASNCFYVAAGTCLASSAMIAFMNSPTFDASSGLAGVPWKWLVLGMISLLPLVLMLVGQGLTDGPSRMRELGIVLLASAAGGILLFLMVIFLSAEPNWQSGLPAAKRWGVSDYRSGAIWIGLLGILGGAAFWAGQTKRKVRSKAA